jgi:hypothetical protein
MRDEDSDGIPNALDTDDDGDGISTRKEITDANGVLIPFASIPSVVTETCRSTRIKGI